MYYYRVAAVGETLLESPASAINGQSTWPSELSNFPVAFATETSSHCAVGDVTGDGRLEIVLGADEIYAWTDDGGEVVNGDNDSQTLGPLTGLGPSFQPAGITLADLDGEPGLEIIGSRNGWPETEPPNEIHIYKPDASFLPGWPQTLLPFCPSLLTEWPTAEVTPCFGLFFSRSLGLVRMPIIPSLVSPNTTGPAEA